MTLALTGCEEARARTPDRKTISGLGPLAREMAADALLLNLSAVYRPGPLVFTNPQVIDLRTGTVTTPAEVHTAGGRITHVGAAIRAPSHAVRVEADGHFLMPGLIDAHQHFGGSSTQWLLDIGTGVTTVRDLAAPLGLLSYRSTVESADLLIPSMVLAGPMLNYRPLDVYAHVVRSPDEGRQRVRALAAAGFDEIKVWNVLPLEILAAAAQEAAAVGVPLTGHVPHGVSLADAMKTGMSPIEHLKGFYLDDRLELTTEDYLAVTVAHPGVWITPTLHNSCSQGLRGQAAHRFVSNSVARRFVHRSVRDMWLARFGAEPEALPAEARVCDMSRQIFAELVEAGVRSFIAGTDDNGGNAFQVSGFTLHEEMKRLSEGGLDNLEVLRAATWNPALALGRDAEFGVVAPGARADLLLLAANPLDDLRHLLGDRGVMVRGAWLDAVAIRELLDKHADILREVSETDPEDVVRHYTGVEFAALSNPQQLKRVALTLRQAGHSLGALRVMETAVARFPWYDTYESRGDAHLAVGDSAAALDDYRAAIQMNPHNDALILKLNALRPPH